MAGKIFINYRRDDSGGTAGRLHDRLAQTFGRKNLFMDVDHIPAGVDFVDYLPSQVAACDVFLAVIGPNWLDAKDDDGRRRFDNPDDFVTIEIAAALARNIRVIPVLVDGARTPKADKLPDSIKPLVRRNAVEVRNTNFGRDAEALANKVREALKDAPAVPRRWPLMTSAAAWLMAPGQLAHGGGECDGAAARGLDRALSDGRAGVGAVDAEGGAAGCASRRQGQGGRRRRSKTQGRGSGATAPLRSLGARVPRRKRSARRRKPSSSVAAARRRGAQGQGGRRSRSEAQG